MSLKRGAREGEGGGRSVDFLTLVAVFLVDLKGDLNAYGSDLCGVRSTPVCSSGVWSNFVLFFSPRSFAWDIAWGRLCL